MKQLFFVLAVIGLGLSSCERHEWESEPNPKDSDTINLFKHEPKKDGKGEEKEHAEEEKPKH